MLGREGDAAARQLDILRRQCGGERHDRWRRACGEGPQAHPRRPNSKDIFRNRKASCHEHHHWRNPACPGRFEPLWPGRSQFRTFPKARGLTSRSAETVARLLQDGRCDLWRQYRLWQTGQDADRGGGSVEAADQHRAHRMRRALARRWTRALCGSSCCSSSMPCRRVHRAFRWRRLETLAALLNADVLPVIPGQGSVGASGDLAPLAHLEPGADR